MDLLPYLISGLALALSLISFLWTFYKDTTYRARVCVSVTNQQQHGPVLDVVNYGPGSITLDFMIFDSRPWHKRLFSRESHKTTTFPTPPIGKTLQAGETFRSILGDQPLILGKRVMTRVGVCDMTRKAYFAPSRQVKAVVKERRNSPQWRALFQNRNV